VTRTAATRIEISLDELGRKLESVNFLTAIAAGTFAMYIPMLLLLRVTGRLNSYNLLLWSTLFVLSLIWSTALARIWRWPVLFASAGYTLIWSYTLVTYDTRILHGSLAETATRLLPLSFGLALLLRVAYDGWRISRTAEKERDLLTSVPPGALTPGVALQRAVGISPVCHWISQRARRLFAAILFVLTALGTGLLTTTTFLLLSAPLATAVWDIAPYCRVDVHECVNRFAGAFIFVLALFGAMVFMPTLLRVAARRVARVSLETLELRDKRAPVLFLRSFQDDQVKLPLPRRPVLQRLIGIGEPRPTVDHLLVEEASMLGPVIAIGSPSKPAPFGAPRIFFDDDAWQRAVSEIAAAASMIVIVVDETPGVTWELALIRNAGHAAKTLYLVPPATARHTTEAIIRRETANEGLSEATESAADLKERSDAAIGWFRSSDGRICLLTDVFPSRSSYVCALRMFIRSRLSPNSHVLASEKTVVRV
jgi:hypothetical protein